MQLTVDWLDVGYSDTLTLMTSTTERWAVQKKIGHTVDIYWRFILQATPLRGTAPPKPMIPTLTFYPRTEHIYLSAQL